MADYGNEISSISLGSIIGGALSAIVEAQSQAAHTTVNFINEVVEKLNLKNIKAIHSRAEEAGTNNKYREKFDIATSRAVSKLNTLVEYMIPFVKVGGECICLKGPNIISELEESKRAIDVLGGKIKKVEEFLLPESDIARTIVIIEKIAHTPKQYPRKAGTPNNKPL